jgi:hypothetical protein
MSPEEKQQLGEIMEADPKVGQLRGEHGDVGD